MSHDLEDIVTLIDGRASITDDINNLTVAAPAARSFIMGECAKLAANPYFSEALREHLPRLQGARERAAIVLERFKNISRLPTNT